MNTANTGREFQIIRHNINNVELCVSNYGKFGQDETGNNAGCWWPVGSGHSYIYGAGIWVGAVDTVSGDTLVTIGYGPHGGEVEFAPGLCGMSVSDPRAIIFLYPHLWPPPAVTFPMSPQIPNSHQDSWCVYNDSNIAYHIAGDTSPIGIEIYQSVYVWNLYLLMDIAYLVFEIKNVSGQNMTEFYLGICTDIDIGNEASAGNATDRCSAIVGQWYVIDGDSFWIDNLAYQWQEIEEPGTPPWFPGAIGFDLIRTPYDLVEGEDKDDDGIYDQFERDSVYFVNNLPPGMWDVDHDGVQDWRDPSEIPQLGMTAFKRFTLNLEPNLDYERYMTLAGYNFRTCIYEPYDTVPPDPDDQRWLQASGPFELQSDSTVTLVLALMFADWNSYYMRPDTGLVLVDYWAQLFHDMNWLMSGAPPQPRLTVIPGDARITLVWDNGPEQSTDPWFNIVGADPSSPYYDPFYRQYDFEGYRVWRSATGQPGTWEMLASFDLNNDIAFADTAFEPEPLAATNTGISHMYVDEDVRNGFVYHYTVTSFDYNRIKTTYDSVFVVESLPFVHIDTLGNYDTMWVYWYDSVEVYGPLAIWFESGFRGDSIRARRDPANYVPPAEPMIDWVSGNNEITELVNASVAYPQGIDANYPLYIEYLAPDTATVFLKNQHNHQIPYTGGRYTALLRDDERILDTISYVARIGSGYLHHEIMPPANGMFIKPDIGTPELPDLFQVFDSVHIVTGTYPDTFLVASVEVELPAAADSADTAYMHGIWAWRGNDYQVVWRRKNPGGPVNTIEVTDLATGDAIPYQQYQNTPATRYLGGGWCFTYYSPTLGNPWIEQSHDTLQPQPAFAGPLRTRYLYVNGGMIALRRNQAVLDSILPSDGETWVIHANDSHLPPSVCGTVRITGTPGIFTDTVQALNVKVVPNPFVIASGWQTRYIERRLKFINLPDKCTIRIFNLNGELVRSLKHNATSLGGVSNDLGGDEWWNCLGEYNQLVSSGVYIFHVESDVGEQVGKFVIIN